MTDRKCAVCGHPIVPMAGKSKRWVHKHPLTAVAASSKAHDAEGGREIDDRH